MPGTARKSRASQCVLSPRKNADNDSPGIKYTFHPLIKRICLHLTKVDYVLSFVLTPNGVVPKEDDGASVETQDSQTTE